MIAKQPDDDDARVGSPLTVELAIQDAELAERVRGMIAAAPDMVVVGAGEASARVRIAAGARPLEDGAPALMLTCVGDGDGLPTASGVVSSQTPAAALHAAIRATAQGLAVFSDEWREAAMEERDTAGLASVEDEATRVDLTPREMEVLRLLAEGASNKVIARRLDITPHTAKFHVASIIAKLGATGRTDAVIKAMRLGLVMI